MYRRLRLRYGLHWQKQRPDLKPLIEFFKNVMLILSLLLIYGLVGRLDYESARAEELERQAHLSSTTLLDCLNGRARWVTEDQKQLVACDVWSTKL